MRTIRKRLTVKNDGFCRSSQPAAQRIRKVLNRYLEKMSKKGWIPSDIFAGNCFSCYENIVYLNKPKNFDEEQIAKKLEVIFLDNLQEQAR